MRTMRVSLIALGLVGCGGRVDLPILNVVQDAGLPTQDAAGNGAIDTVITTTGTTGSTVPITGTTGTGTTGSTLPTTGTGTGTTDTGTTDTGTTGSTGTTGTGTSTGSAPARGGSGAPSGGACWFDQLPQVSPILPSMSVQAACAMGPTTWQSGDGMGSSDARGTLVGRWVPCGIGGLSPVPHAGVEFGANGRWRLLDTDASGALVPSASQDSRAHGRYYALSSGQLNIDGEGFEDGTAVFFASFAPGMDLVRLDGGAPSGLSSKYARTAPSPSNGWDNLPSVSDGKCSMVGTWFVPTNTAPPGAPAATFSFDELGNFVGGPRGSDLCASHTMYGTYRLSPGLFQLTSNVGMGVCQWAFDAGYPATFDEDCTHLSLTQMYDNCTGGRGYFNQKAVLTRLP